MRDRLGDKIRLQHILDAIEEIENYTRGVNISEFTANSMMFNATLRQLEIMGEAANRLSDNLLAENDDVPWAKIIGLRNLVIHEYFGIDDIMIWNIIHTNIPPFKLRIAVILQNIT